MYVLDIGGEGRHPEAVNLNPSRVQTLGPNRGQAIPHLIVGRGEAIPLSDSSVDCVFVERTPLSQATLREIARVTVSGGTVVLRHVPFPNIDPHVTARRLLGGTVIHRDKTKRNRLLIQETVIRTGSAVRSTMPV